MKRLPPAVPDRVRSRSRVSLSDAGLELDGTEDAEESGVSAGGAVMPIRENEDVEAESGAEELARLYGIPGGTDLDKGDVGVVLLLLLFLLAGKTRGAPLDVTGESSGFANG